MVNAAEHIEAQSLYALFFGALHGMLRKAILPQMQEAILKREKFSRASAAFEQGRGMLLHEMQTRVILLFRRFTRKVRARKAPEDPQKLRSPWQVVFNGSLGTCQRNPAQNDKILVPACSG